MKNRIRVAVAGYGVMGRRRAALLETHPDCELIAVEDEDYRRLFEQPVDALFVCLPNFLAARATVTALERGLHVFCEKPAGRNLDDLAAIRRAHHARLDRRLMFGFNHRHHGSVRRALQVVQSGSLGAVTGLNGIYTKTLMEGWRTDRRQAGGGILLDQGIHMVDLFRLFAGDFVSCKSRVRSLDQGAVEDDCRALLETADGVVAALHSSATAAEHRFRLDIALDLGEITLDGILSGTMRYAPERLIVRGEQGSEEIFDVDDSFRAEVASFVTAIQQPDWVHGAGIGDAWSAMSLVYRIYCADEQWRNEYDLRNEPRELWT